MIALAYMPAASAGPSDWMIGATLATAVFTALAAAAAWRGAKATEKTSQGQLLSDLYKEFWSDEFRTAGRLLKDLKERHGEGFAKTFVNFREAQGPAKDEEQQKAADRDDSARRTVKAYYYKLYRFKEADFLSESEIRNLLTSEVNVRLFLGIVEPLEKELSDELDHGGYAKEREIFDFFDDLYDRSVERPLR